MLLKNKVLIGIAIAGVIATAGFIIVNYNQAGENRTGVSASLQEAQSVALAPPGSAHAHADSDVSVDSDVSKKITCADISKTDQPLLQAYIVSACPFGMQMQRVLSQVTKDDPSVASRIEVRYIGGINSSGQLTSMHGDSEASENLRQVCLREEQPDKYWSYVLCNIKRKGDTDNCLVQAGVDTGKLDACVQDQNRGLKYAKDDVDLTAKYKINGSPTLVMNGQEVSEFNFGGRTADAVKNIVCCGFSNQPSGCSKTLSKTSPPTGYSATFSN